MKKITLSILICTLIISFSFLSCGKYEEGPGISFIPKLVRLQHSWRCIEEVSSNGVASSPADDGSYVEFREGGIYRVYDHAYMSPFNVSFIAGTWELSDDKTQIFINCTYTDPIFNTVTNLAQPDDTCTIVRLKQNDLGLRDKDGDKYYYVHQ